MESKRFQIDSIIITQYAIFLIEVKNYNGTITFDTLLKQFIRSDGKRETGFRYPITQAQHQQFHFLNWLYEQKYNIPVYCLIAISDPSTIIKVVGDDQESLADIVVHAEYLPMKIKETDKKLSSIQQSLQQNKRIGKSILAKCIDFDMDIIRQYNIKYTDLLPGVHCPECKKLGMERKHKKWYCLKCGKFSRFAHHKALSDYFLLYKSYITNQECIDFLQINSRHVGKRLLKEVDLQYDARMRRWGKA